MPCAAVGLVVLLTRSPRWRARWLEILVSTMERAGCSFQKFGQWLSMRPDMVAPDVANALAKLRTESPAHDFEVTRDVLRESLGADIGEWFDSFDVVPVSSGTVAQVNQL